MIQRLAIVAVLASGFFALSACATSRQGWTGSNAQPFDQALSACHSEADKIADEQQRNAALDQCMAAKGWTRK